jgi:hypothetical protein
MAIFTVQPNGNAEPAKVPQATAQGRVPEAVVKHGIDKLSTIGFILEDKIYDILLDNATIRYAGHYGDLPIEYLISRWDAAVVICIYPHKGNDFTSNFNNTLLVRLEITRDGVESQFELHIDELLH